MRQGDAIRLEAGLGVRSVEVRPRWGVGGLGA